MSSQCCSTSNILIVQQQTVILKFVLRTCYKAHLFCANWSWSGARVLEKLFHRNKSKESQFNQILWFKYEFKFNSIPFQKVSIQAMNWKIISKLMFAFLWHSFLGFDCMFIFACWGLKGTNLLSSLLTCNDLDQLDITHVTSDLVIPHLELWLGEAGQVQSLLTIAIAPESEAALTVVRHQAGADPGAIGAGVLLTLSHTVWRVLRIESAYEYDL